VLPAVTNVRRLFRMGFPMILESVLQGSDVANVPSQIHASSNVLQTCTVGHPTLLTTSVPNKRTVSSKTRTLRLTRRRLSPLKRLVRKDMSCWASLTAHLLQAIRRYTWLRKEKMSPAEASVGGSRLNDQMRWNQVQGSRRGRDTR